MRERKRIRLKGYDYASPGPYFVTICVLGRDSVFGEITDGIISLSSYGEIVQQQWQWLFEQYDYLQSDEFMVMPNHFHGIIHIMGNDHCGYQEDGRDSERNGHNRSLRKIKPLPQLVGAFKTRSSKLIHQTAEISFQWQKSYYEHIVRNEKELHRIRDYIANNPINWQTDIENTAGNGHDRSLLPAEIAVKQYYQRILEAEGSNK
jgi:putative transposase